MNPSRRQLLRGNFSGISDVIRPPWALPDLEFSNRCTRCSDCIRICPEGIIRSGSGGFPEVDFQQRGCTLCRDCATACTARALDPERDPPWRLRVEIRDTCLAQRRVLCRSCGDACDERAIRFALQVGGIARPRIDGDRCTGCGFCVGVCPVQALKIEPDATESTP